MTNTRKAELEALCLRFRNELIDVLHAIQTGHPGGSLSCCEIVTTLYQDIMNIDPQNPEMKGRDHFVLSKGHAAPMLYINLAEKGYFPKDEMKTLRQLGSRLQGHPCAHKLPGVEFSTGPLGLGLGAGLGIMLADRLQGHDSYTYVLLGDGEIEEGAIWEAAMAAAKFKADHLIAILDYNGVQLDGTVEEIIGSFRLVRGTPEHLTDAVRQASLGLRSTSLGWEAMMPADAAEALTDRIVVEVPTIEDLAVHIAKEAGRE